MTRRTYAYKVVGGNEILADVYQAGRRRSPVIVWLHGGALMMGHRGNLAESQAQEYLAAGYRVVAIDYRLAPETKLPAIIEDLQDAFRWVQAIGPELFGADPGRIGVVGGSAGGYLALMAGCCVQPRPRALVSFYGYGDIVGEWYTTASPHYSREAPVSHDAAWAAVGERPISESGEERGPFYLHCRQQGIWPRIVSGSDPEAAPEFFRRYCPAQNVGPDYPPTLLLHGDADTDVPYEKSQMMARALARAGVEHRLITIPGGPHGFDAATDSPPVREAWQAVLAFLASHLQG